MWNVTYTGLADDRVEYVCGRTAAALRAALDRPDAKGHAAVLAACYAVPRPRVTVVGVPLPVDDIRAVVGGRGHLACRKARSAAARRKARAAVDAAEREINLFRAAGTGAHVLLLYSTAKGGYDEMVPLFAVPPTILHHPELSTLFADAVDPALAFSTDLCAPLRGLVCTMRPLLEALLARHTDSALFFEIKFVDSLVSPRCVVNTGRRLAPVRTPWVHTLLHFAAGTVASGFYGDRHPPLVVAIILSPTQYALAGVTVSAGTPRTTDPGTATRDAAPADTSAPDGPAA